MQTHVEARRQPLVSSAMLSALLLRQGLSLAWSSHTELCCLANDPPHLCLHGAGIIGMSQHSWLWFVGSRNRTQVHKGRTSLSHLPRHV